MKESFILHANKMSKCMNINLLNNNVIKIDIKSSKPVMYKGFSDTEEIFSGSLNNDNIEIDLSQISRGTIDEINLIVYILDAFTELEVELEVTLECKVITLNGDFHCHTRSSGDGRYVISELAEKANQLDLDFITTTDHNSIVANFVEEESILIIPGLELTNKFGHCNMLGKKVPLTDFTVNTYEQELAKINEAKNNGAIFVANHPFSPKSRSWLVPILDVTPDLVEIWNGPWGMHNRVAFEWWVDLLNSGKYIPAIGGSDFHFEDENKALNRPTNQVQTRFNNSEGILESVLNGSNIIKDTNINFKYTKTNEKISIEITNVNEEVCLYYYDRYNTTYKTISTDYKEEILIEDVDKYFVVVICDSSERDREFLLISNPLIMKG